MNLPVLRDYQEYDLNQLRHAFLQHRAVLLTQPCGAGKGTLASYIVKKLITNGYRVHFWVDRRALVDDMSKRVLRLGVPHGVLMGDDNRHDPLQSAQVVSIDTITRRQNPPPADYIIVDEARFSISPKWMKVFAQYPAAKILGLDATPARTSGEGLGVEHGGIYEKLVVGPSAQNLIDRGFLVRSHVIAPPGPAAPSRMVGGEFAPSAVSAVVNTNKIIGDVQKHWQKYASERKTIGFGADQNHCTNMAEIFRGAGIDAATVFDSTPTKVRRQLFEDFETGGLRVLFSVGVIGYGVDFPICKAIIDAAHTASLSKAIQRWARGSRPYAGYDHFIVLDHVGNIDRKSKLAPNGFGFYEDDRVWSLDGLAVRSLEGDTSPGIVTCPACYHRFRSGRRECPACEAIIPVKLRNLRVVDTELEERRRAQQKEDAIEAWKTKLSEDDKRTKYLQWVDLGNKRGYKKSWARNTHFRVFGAWPPKSWDAGAERRSSL